MPVDIGAFKEANGERYSYLAVAALITYEFGT